MTQVPDHRKGEDDVELARKTTNANNPRVRGPERRNHATTRIAQLVRPSSTTADGASGWEDPRCSRSSWRARIPVANRGTPARGGCYTRRGPAPAEPASTCPVPSSRGLGHHPLKVETRVRIPLGLLPSTSRHRCCKEEMPTCRSCSIHHRTDRRGVVDRVGARCRALRSLRARARTRTWSTDATPRRYPRFGERGVCRRGSKGPMRISVKRPHDSGRAG